MRFNFDSPDSKAFTDGRQSMTPPSTSTPAEQLQWLPLQNHALFAAPPDGDDLPTPPSAKIPTNLLAWDGASRLYFWDPAQLCLHRIAIKLGEPDSSSVLAASPAKVLQPDLPLDYEVQKISINQNGSAILLSGLGKLSVMYLFGRSSAKQSTVICRTVEVGSEVYFSSRILQVYWHPCSDTHIGILSSDSVFRIFNLSVSLQQPEHEYYLQPGERDSSLRASSICPVDFSFGGRHMWDIFSVFILFSDASVYILCPVIPFGSLYKKETILEIYSDAKTFELKSSNSKAVSDSSMAISWLEETFPELAQRVTEGGNSFPLKAQPYTFMDSSLLLQGPLSILNDGEEILHEVEDTECEGRAVSFIYDLVGKDSILIIARSGGLLQIDELADEIQPFWKASSPPRILVDSHDQILGIAMICESVSTKKRFLQPDRSLDCTAWGHPPPLLSLAVVDLALPGNSGSSISMSVDPLMPERIYCIHDGGVDAVVLHFLPFTSHTTGKEGAKRDPSVHQVISSCLEESSLIHPIRGFLPLADSAGDQWIVGLTFSRECVVREMETWTLSLPCILDLLDDPTCAKEQEETKASSIISQDLLGGPRAVLLPPPSRNLRSVAADSIDGRSIIHQYFKLFHENYMEYAHKVHYELKNHAPRGKEIIGDLHSRLQGMVQKITEVEQKQEGLEDRITCAIERHTALEQRLLKLKNLPGLHKKPLSKAERAFKSELDRFKGLELDALGSTIEALDARLKRLTVSPKGNVMNKHRDALGRRGGTLRDGMDLLRSNTSKLLLLNNENNELARVIESALRSREVSNDLMKLADCFE